MQVDVGTWWRQGEHLVQVCALGTLHGETDRPAVIYMVHELPELHVMERDAFLAVFAPAPAPV